MHTPSSAQHLTFDALLQPLAAPLVGTPPLPLLRSLVLRLLTVSALGGDREERQRGSPRADPACHPQRRAGAEEGASLLCVGAQGPRVGATHLPARVRPPGGGDELLQAGLLHTQRALDVEEDGGPEHVEAGTCQGRALLTEGATSAPESHGKPCRNSPTTALPPLTCHRCSARLPDLPQALRPAAVKPTKPNLQQGHSKGWSPRQMTVDRLESGPGGLSISQLCFCLLEAEDSRERRQPAPPASQPGARSFALPPQFMHPRHLEKAGRAGSWVL